MKFQKNRFVLPIIIILLVIFLPCAVFGVLNEINIRMEGGNPNHLHKLDNKLFYYDKNDKLIGTYKCKSSDCDDAITNISDEYLSYYEGTDTSLEVFANSYVFIKDNNLINLVSLKHEESMTLVSFSEIKNYGTSIEGGSLIVKDVNNKYGLFNMNNIMYEIPAEYDFMGISKKEFNGTVLSKDKIVVKKDNDWYLINGLNKAISVSSLDPIYDYNDSYIYYINSDGNYLIYDYNGYQSLSWITIKKVEDYNDLHVVKNALGKVFIYNENYSDVIQEYSEYNQTFDFRVNDNCVDILNNGKVVYVFE